jgi:hypothetical protein
VQSCVLGRCTAHAVNDAAMPDADIDAAIDARPDAAPLVCEVNGLACNGTPTTFQCGSHCWVHCPSGATWSTASTACTGWMGALGQIDNMLEQTCVTMYVSGSNWIGLRQLDTATMRDRDWYWNNPNVAVDFTHWDSGKPDDGDGRENHAEQCGKLDGTTWDDASCSQINGFLCERPLFYPN